MSAPVLKFGGTSVKNLGRIQHVANIIVDRLANGPVVVVVSAMGDTTDYLLQMARSCSSQPNQREVDQLLATGEQVSVSLLSLSLSSMGIKAISLTAAQAGITCDGIHGNARITDIDKHAIESLLRENQVVVIAGFQAMTDAGDIATLGRGGSDTTAVAIAASLGSECCDIYTDVDGVFSADPNKISAAKLIRSLDPKAVLKMARLGAQVLHPRAVELASHYGLPLRVRNTFKPADEGSLIKSGGEEFMESHQKVQAIAIKSRQARICFGIDDTGVLPIILKRLSENGLCLEHIQIAETRGNTVVSGYVDEEDVSRVVKELGESGAIIELPSDTAVALVSLVGLGASAHNATVTAALAELQNEDIALKGLIGAEEALTLAIDEENCLRLARVLHKRFIECAQPSLTPASQIA